MSKKNKKNKSKPLKMKSKPKYALLVWAMLPETIDYYLLPFEEIGKAGRRAVRRAHGHYIGAEVRSEMFGEEEINRSMLYINNALVADLDAKWIDDDYFEREAEQLGMSIDETKELVHSWAKYKLDVTTVRALPRLRLVQTGCVM